MSTPFRQLKTVTVTSYSGELDQYGQSRQEIGTTRNVEMVVKINTQQAVDNPIYNNVQIIGLTMDKTINDTNTITIDGVVYNVLHVIPSDRFYQIFLSNTKIG